MIRIQYWKCDSWNWIRLVDPSPLRIVICVLKVDNANEGDYAKPEIGTIVVKIYRAKVTGPYEGKWETQKHPRTNTKPILMSEKSKQIDVVDTRVTSVSVSDLDLTLTFIGFQNQRR